MPQETTTTTVWICARCKKRVESETRPNTPSDAWGTVKVNQDAGWDMQGHPWAPRMREPIEMCGDCIEDVVRMVNGFVIRFDGPPGPENPGFVEIETEDGRSVSMGSWERDGDYWLLRFRPHRDEA